MNITLRQPYSFLQQGKRGNQEDARFPDTDAPQDVRPAFVVCDGVGGQDKGEVASRLVAQAFGGGMRHYDLARPFGEREFAALLSHSLQSLKDNANSATRDMATTLTFVCFHAGGVFCAHIGDSRIYHVRPGVGIMYQSEDHSLVNALVHSGNLTPQQAINHPKGNIITRCVRIPEKGEEPSAATTLQITDVEPGDYFFLCTDGVVHQISDAEIFAILSSDIPDKDKMAMIAENSKDSSDNNTAYLIGVESVEGKEEVMVTDIEEGGDTAPIFTGEMTAVKEVGVPQKRENILSRFFKSLFS